MAGEVVQGPLVCRRHDDGRVEIISAPQTTYMSLAFLMEADKHIVRMSGREIHIAGQVTYRVTGWDDIQACLVLERVGEGN